MSGILARIFNDSSTDLKGKIIGLYLLLIGVNIAVWLWAFFAFHAYPLQLGTALVAYTFGLRHAVDADHIAAIDNVTRKLMQEGKRPVGVGFFFSLGHSTIVVLASVAIALTAAAFKSHLGKDQLEAFGSIGGIIGTLVSALFLLAIAIMNILILVRVYQTFQHVKAGGAYDDEDLNLLLAKGGFISRLCRPLFKMITQSWHMYPLGFLFGLGFDTATEIGVLGISAASASQGMPVWSILVFPALFTAGMSLIDTTDSVLMLGAYGWAFVKPIRKLFYNMTITAVSVIVALVVGGIEALGLIAGQLNLKGGIWDTIGNLNDNFGTIGYLIIGIFIGAWLISLLIYRLKGYDNLNTTAPNET
jgi:nickel/cobalt transporter (NiCoT) family protein